MDVFSTMLLYICTSYQCQGKHSALTALRNESHEVTEHLGWYRGKGRAVGQPPEKGCDQRDPVSSPHQDVGRDLKGSQEWKQVCNHGSKRTLSLPTTSPQVPLHNRYEALAVEDQSVDDAGVDPSTPEESRRTERPAPCITTTSTRKKRRVTFAGDSSEGNRGSNTLGRPFS